MKSEPTIITTAEFNPKIKIYRLLVVAFFMVITFIGIPFLIVWFLGLGQYISRRYYENLMCRLTDRHLEFRKGVFFKVEKTIPLENIQDLTFLDNPILQWLDLRILKIETAGQSNPQGSDMKLIGIKDTAGFKEQVLEQREKLRTDKNPANPSGQNRDDELMDLLREMKGLLEDIKGK